MERFGALGDIHGDFDAARRIMTRHPEIPFWLCVGDVADANGRYEPLPAPLHFIKGNNEGFDAIAGGQLPENLHYLPNAKVRTIDAVRVAGLGGTFAPTWFEIPAAELPYPRGGRATAEAPAARARRDQPPPRLRRSAGASAKAEVAEHAASGGGAPRAVRDDKRRHFVREEVEACKALARVDVFMTHEAPRPYFVRQNAGGTPGATSASVGSGGRGHDAGKTAVNEILASAKPRLHLFGHHHRFTEQEPQGVRSVGLDLVSKSFLLLDVETLAYELIRL